MKRLVILLLAILLAGPFAFGQTAAKAGQFGIQTSFVFTGTGAGSAGSFGAKYMITNTIAVRAALGFLNESVGGFGTTLFDIAAAGEFHFGGKGGVSPYAGAELSFSTAAYAGGGNAPSAFGLCATFGGEYFFSGNFSWAGEVRAGYGSSTTGGGTTTTSFGILGFATFLTWYIT